MVDNFTPNFIINKDKCYNRKLYSHSNSNYIQSNLFIIFLYIQIGINNKSKSKSNNDMFLTLLAKDWKKTKTELDSTSPSTSTTEPTQTHTHTHEDWGCLLAGIWTSKTSFRRFGKMELPLILIFLIQLTIPNSPKKCNLDNVKKFPAVLILS